MESLVPSTRGCRFTWEADSLSYHARCNSSTDCLHLVSTKVFALQLSIGVWNQGGSSNIRLPAMVCIALIRKMQLNCISYIKVPAPESGWRQRCLQVLQFVLIEQRDEMVTSITEKPFLSASKAQEFLRQMSSTAESDCDCLPDCELMDLQYSVSTTNLMWVMQDLSALRGALGGSCSIQSSRINPVHKLLRALLCNLPLCDGILFIGQPLFWADSPVWFFQAMWLPQPQPEPPLHAEGRTVSCSLDGEGDKRADLIIGDF